MSKKKKQTPTIRSSAAEYLTFIAAAGSTESSIEMRYEDENIWLTQKMMATLYDVSVSAINQHLKNIFEEGELQEKVVSSILEHTTQHGAISQKTQTINSVFDKQLKVLESIKKKLKKLDKNKDE